MSTAVISRRYARALIRLAARTDQLEPVGAALDDLADALTVAPRLAQVLAEPRVSPAEKDALLAELAARTQAPPLVANFVRLVARKRRAALLGEIRDIYHQLADARLGRAVAEVTVAAALTPAQEEKIRANLAARTGQQITLTVAVDPAILGGAVTRIGSQVWDGSLRNQLNGIRQSIMEG